MLLSAGVGATPVLAMLHALGCRVFSARGLVAVWGAQWRRSSLLCRKSRGLLQGLHRAGVTSVQQASVHTTGWSPTSTLPVILTSPRSSSWVCRATPISICVVLTSFLHDLTAGLAGWGVSADRVHEEVFGPGEAITPGHSLLWRFDRRIRPRDWPGAGPRVSFARSGIEVAWDPKYQSLLELAEACDVPVKWSCRTGVCHTCESALISGAVTYQPEPLQPPAEGNVLICCCQPRDEVVIDI